MLEDGLGTRSLRKAVIVSPGAVLTNGWSSQMNEKSG